jgi:hypothetical protein
MLMPIPIIIPFGYAETHYRIPLLFSFLRKREPEIVADVPHRIDPERSLPVLLIVKDAHLYPVFLNKISVYVDKKNIFEQDINRNLEQAYSEQFFNMDVSGLPPGLHKVDIKLEYSVNGRKRTCFNDNYRTTRKEAFPCYLGSSALPRFDNYILGEMHAHTHFTNDQIEFAASPDATAVMAQAMGLRFFCATDHSYDLDDLDGDYTQNDPSLNRWIRFRAELAEFNHQADNFCILPGEEVSARSIKDKNIHLLVYNSERFYPGSGDSGDHWLRTRSEHSIEEIRASLSDDAIAVAAHPVDNVPLVQQLLLGRRRWRTEDVIHAQIGIVQIINGTPADHLEKAILFWKQLLLSGKRVFAIAGNDAHGNFGRYRQMGIPFLTIRESQDQLFGEWKTGIFHSDSNVTPFSIVQRLKTGNYYMTNGPAVKISVTSGERAFPMGSRVKNPQSIQLQGLSNEEFGSIQSIRILQGKTGTKAEQVWFEKLIEDECFQVTVSEPIPPVSGTVYYRADLISSNERGRFHAYTNPIWVDKDNL